MSHKGRSAANDRLAVLIAGGWTVRAACKRIGLAEKTGYRRTNDPAFQARVKELRGGLIRTAAGRLAGNMNPAAKVLRGLLKSGDEHVRFRRRPR